MQLRKRLGVIFLCVLAITVFAMQSQAAVPGMINYQGQLNDAAGTPVADGTYSMRFSLFDAGIDGDHLWNPPTGEEQDVIVIKGIYNVQLGAGVPLDSAVFDHKTVWLEVAVYNTVSRAWETLSPRQQVTSVAYALKAGDADTLEGKPAAGFSLVTHEHDIAYVNENQANSVTGTMITDSSVGVSDIADSAISGNKILDNSISAADLAAGSVGSSEVSDESLTAADLGPNSVGTSEVIDNSLTASDLAAGSVTASEIADGAVTSSKIAANAVTDTKISWSLDHTSADANGGLLGLTNSADASSGNYPMGISASVTGSPLTFNPVMGVFGGAPGLGQGAPMTSFPKTKIGVGGASDTGYGVAGVSTSAYGVYGYSTSSYGGYFSAAGVSGRGIYATANGSNATALYGSSSDGTGLYAFSSASGKHAASFYNNAGAGLNGSTLYARSWNSTADGIALWAHNDHSTSTDATAVLSNDGTGPLLKGFGGNGGEDEFRINNDGTVLIFNDSGVTTVKIDPSEGGTTTGSQITLYDGTGNVSIELDGDYAGKGRISTQELQITGGSDLSENFDVKPGEFEIGPGMVVCIDPERPGHLKVSRQAYDNKVAGIISGAGGIRTGMLMGQQGSEADGRHPVALTGRVYCRADATTRAIRPGDLLTTSDLPGHAMKVTDHGKAGGSILGKAMTGLENGTGLVLVLVSLQ